MHQRGLSKTKNIVLQLERKMATHSSVLPWRIPETGEPGRLPLMGSHRVGHDWSDLAEAAADSKESACNAGDLGWMPGLGRSPGEGNSYPLQYSGLEKSTDYTMGSQRVRACMAKQLSISLFTFMKSEKGTFSWMLRAREKSWMHFVVVVVGYVLISGCSKGSFTDHID